MLKHFLALALIISPSAAFAMGSVPQHEASAGLIGNMAPNFLLPTTLVGQKSLAQAREGKKTILFFWATWCPHCHEALMHLSKNAAALEQQGIKLVLVDLGEKKEDVGKYLDSTWRGVESFLDVDTTLQETYQIAGVPTMFFLDANGVIRAITHDLPDNYAELFTASP